MNRTHNDDPSSVDEVVIERSLAAEANLVRGILHELAQTGAWTGLADVSAEQVTLLIDDAGAGASTIKVRQPLAAGDDPDSVRQRVVDALDDLDRTLVERTTDAS